MIDWLSVSIGTTKDPEREWQRKAVAYLNDAQFCRLNYDLTLQAAITLYGDRHTPMPLFGCAVCKGRGIIHTEHERLNHQTGSVIAGIYADHFPDDIKRALRQLTEAVTLNNHNAAVCWRKAGRRMETFRPLLDQTRVLPDGRISYY